MTDKIVEKAINALTKRINISSGLSHPMDKDAAIDILILLKAEGHLFSAEEIKILAQRNGWGSTGANDLYEITQKIISGKKPRKYSKHFSWNNDFIKVLSEQN